MRSNGQIKAQAAFVSIFVRLFMERWNKWNESIICCHHYWPSPDDITLKLSLENLSEYYSFFFFPFPLPPPPHANFFFSLSTNKLPVLYTHKNSLNIFSSECEYRNSMHFTEIMLLKVATESICHVQILGSDIVAIGKSEYIRIYLNISFIMNGHCKMRLNIISHDSKWCGTISGQSLFITVRNLHVHVTPLIQSDLTGLLYVET